jgi:hypothetical protein
VGVSLILKRTLSFFKTPSPDDPRIAKLWTDGANAYLCWASSNDYEYLKSCINITISILQLNTHLNVYATSSSDKDQRCRGGQA